MTAANKQRTKGTKAGRKARPHPLVEALLIGSLLIGFAFSAVLFVEYRASTGLCSVGSGCDVVRASPYSSVAGVSLPTLGVGWFFLLLVVAVVPRARRALLPLAVAAALGGVTLIALQALVIGAFCYLCLAVDLAAIGTGVAAVLARGRKAPPPTAWRKTAVVLVALVAVSLPFYTRSAGPAAAGDGGAAGEVPDFVIREQREGEAEGAVTIVEFVDFQCPACGLQHRAFREAMARFDRPVRIVYLHAPLPQHEHAADAARAHVCAEEAGRGPEMADALFAADDLSSRTIEALAARLGLRPAAFARCLLSARTAERLERDRRYADEAGLESLPTFWIGRRRLVGAQPPALLLESLEHWASRARPLP